MLMLNFKDMLSQMIHPYEKRINGSANDIRELVALTDLYVRIAYTFIILDDCQYGDSKIKAHNTPGFATMLGVVKRRSTSILNDSVQ